MDKYEVHQSDNVPVKTWTRGVHVDYNAIEQLRNVASLPFIHKWVAGMPDIHWGMGATIGSVIPTKGAIIPAAVGVDIGCGMCAVETDLKAEDLPDTLKPMRELIENVVPLGKNGHEYLPLLAEKVWKGFLETEYDDLARRFPKIETKKNPVYQLGTLGGGNHFIEVCLDETGSVWFMLHSGSRGVGNKIGQYFINLAKEDMKVHFITLPDKNLAYLSEGTEHFDDYWKALKWAQNYALENRQVMLNHIVAAIRKTEKLPPFKLVNKAINCHHNYAARENHYGENVIITRKGAVRARKGDLGIIPGSMGAKSYIVLGLGNDESFHSCSHGAGRVMSRSQAKKEITVEDHAKATESVECRKDSGMLDESPGAYKNIEKVMKAQDDLVEIVHTLKQVVCVKG